MSQVRQTLYQATQRIFLFFGFALFTFGLSNCSSGQQNNNIPIMGLQALQTKSSSGLSGTITIYDLAGEVYLTKELIFTADTIYAPSLSLPKNTVYRLVIVFYYDEDLPIAFLDEDITVGSDAHYSFTLDKENVHFSMSEITSDTVLAALSEDVNSGILPDLDLDDDGYSNIVEYRGGSDPRDATEIPHGPDFDSIEVEYADDGNLITVTVELSDGNYVTDIEPSVSNYGYLQRGGIFDEDLSGDDLDKERTYTLSFNPQYAPVGEITLNLTATNSIGLTSIESVTLTITDNGENVGPVIVFDSLSADSVIGGDVEVAMTAYDRDTITSLDLLSPTSITDTASAAAYFAGIWNTGSQDDGDFTVIATAEDFLGKSTTRRLALSINNGGDGSGPGLQMNVYNANTSVKIDYLNGETVFGVAPFRIIANDASEVSYIELINLSELNCNDADLSNCPLTNHNDGLDDFKTSSSAYTNSFDTTSYTDGDVITMTYWSGDAHGSTSERSFSFTVKNAPTINTVTPITTTVTGGGEVTITWGVEDRTTAVYVLDAQGSNITCAEGSALANDGSCTFTPISSQSYKVRAVYSTENQYGEARTFYTDQTTDTINLDFDADGMVDEDDNCYKTTSTDQTDSDDDGYGDLCDPDKDGDGYVDSSFDFTTFYTDYVGAEVTAANQEYATLYTSTSYAGTNDCDDADANISPGQNEKLNSIDDNCDGENNVFDFSDNEAFDFLRDEEGTNLFQIIGSEQVYFGSDVQSIGDFNGDGYDDYAASTAHGQAMGVVYCADGSVYNATTNACSNGYGGAVYVFLGPIDFSQGGVLSEDAAALEIHGIHTDPSLFTGELKGYAYGDRLSTIAAGDFDGDGCSDLVLGAKGNSSVFAAVDGSATANRKFRGRVTIIWGCNSELFSIAESRISIAEFLQGGDFEGGAMSLYGGLNQRFLGSSLAMGDLNNDGQDELFIGAPEHPNGVTVYDTTYEEAYAGSTYGRAIIAWGPDGSSNRCTSDCEFMLPNSVTPRATATDISNVHTLDETAAQRSNSAFLMIVGETNTDNFSNVMQNLGDIDGDGDIEVAISSYGYGDEGEGAVYIFSAATLEERKPSINSMQYDLLVNLGDGVTPSIAADYMIVGSTENEHLGSPLSPTSQTDYFGNTITSANLDGDDKMDLIVGAPSYNGGEGKVFVFRGSVLSTYYRFPVTGGIASKTLAAPDLESEFGISVAACDVDQDGVDDIFVGATGYSADQGGVFGYLGTIFDFEDGVVPVEFLENIFSEFYGQTSGNQFGNAIRCNDLDGDGILDDLILGEWKYTTNPESTSNNYRAGSVYFITSDYE